VSGDEAQQFGLGAFDAVPGGAAGDAEVTSDLAE
jgi:hypothetical protein